MEDMLCAMLGGQASEEIVFQEITTGASDDLEKATDLARHMVTRYGMSRKLGPRTFGKKEELVFLGRDISETRNYSDATAHAIDEEVSEIISKAHRTGHDTITKHRSKLDEIAQLLIREETLDEDAFNAMFDGLPERKERALGPPRIWPPARPWPNSRGLTPWPNSRGPQPWPEGSDRARLRDVVAAPGGPVAGRSSDFLHGESGPEPPPGHRWQPAANPRCYALHLWSPRRAHRSGRVPAFVPPSSASAPALNHHQNGRPT